MQGTNRSPEPDRLPDTSRLISVTDGLFGTALTVLALGIHLPEIDNPEQVYSNAQFFQHIVSLSPDLLSYALTFFVAGSYWQAHHRIFETIPRTDRRLTWYNLMFLLPVALLPFTTQLVGVRADTISWTIYCINMILIGATFTLEWGYATTHGLNQGDISPVPVTGTLLRNLITPGVFLFSLIVAQFNTTLAFYFPILIPFARFAANRAFPVVEPFQYGMKSSGGPLVHMFWSVATYFPLILIVAWVIWITNYYHGPK